MSSFTAAWTESNVWAAAPRVVGTEALNNDWLNGATRDSQESNTRSRPDGDSEVALDFDPVLVPSCELCHGIIKPDVVFFGDTVPVSRVNLVSTAVNTCDGLVVVGSSLAVHSALRHVRAACQNQIPVVILNVGQTRAETEGLNGILKLESPAGATLAQVADLLA